MEKNFSLSILSQNDLYFSKITSLNFDQKSLQCPYEVARVEVPIKPLVKIGLIAPQQSASQVPKVARHCPGTDGRHRFGRQAGNYLPCWRQLQASGNLW